MALKYCVLPFSFLFYFLSFSIANEKLECPTSFPRRNLGEIHFPFTNNTNNLECGLIPIRGCDHPSQDKEVEVLLGDQRWFKIESIRQEYYTTITIQDHELQQNLLTTKSCRAFHYHPPFPLLSPVMSFQIIDNITLFRCSNHNNNLKNNSIVPKFHFSRYNCPGFDLYFDDPHRKNDTTDHKSPPTSLSACSVIQLPLNTQPDASSTFNASDPFTFLTAEIRIEVALSEPCYVCYYLRGGRCRLEGELCSVHEGSGESTTPGYKILSGTATAAGSIVTMLFVLFFILHLKEQRYNWSGFLNQSRSVYFDIDPYTNPECQDVDYGVPVFSYEDLERATNSFDQSRELGSGGFGNVYYGKLEDAREVAIKRLYDHKRDSKRVKQFMNEIQILTRLRHRNLVSLYGCTSHSSQRLLQVYEYIPNGTLASHLANPGSLPWPVRMKIAIETASALTYLHASGIIHRDVKTNNILLDDNFCVKVGDFGISRLSPSGVTHVTTAPQGTMGYVDPEYQENCHLTDKSDVYSFGVVLIELISSLPAIDFERINVHEIKLANLAMNKVRGRAFSELVDPSLGFESDKDQSGN